MHIFKKLVKVFVLFYNCNWWGKKEQLLIIKQQDVANNKMCQDCQPIVYNISLEKFSLKSAVL